MPESFLWLPGRRRQRLVPRWLPGKRCASFPSRWIMELQAIVWNLRTPGYTQAWTKTCIAPRQRRLRVRCPHRRFRRTFPPMASPMPRRSPLRARCQSRCNPQPRCRPRRRSPSRTGSGLCFRRGWKNCRMLCRMCKARLQARHHFRRHFRLRHCRSPKRERRQRPPRCLIFRPQHPSRHRMSFPGLPSRIPERRARLPLRLFLRRWLPVPRTRRPSLPLHRIGTTFPIRRCVCPCPRLPRPPGCPGRISLCQPRCGSPQ